MKRLSLPELAEVGSQSFHDIVFNACKRDVRTAILELIRREREGEIRENTADEEGRDGVVGVLDGAPICLRLRHLVLRRARAAAAAPSSIAPVTRDLLTLPADSPEPFSPTPDIRLF